MLRTAILSLAALTLMSAGALAETSQSGATQTPTHARGSGSETLSTKLAQSNGTIRPPANAADPGMVAKPSQTGTMPIITPHQKNGPGVVAK